MKVLDPLGTVNPGGPTPASRQGIHPDRVGAGCCAEAVIVRAISDPNGIQWRGTVHDLPGHLKGSRREILYRARMDGREAALIRAMGIEVRRYLERKGVRGVEE